MYVFFFSCKTSWKWYASSTERFQSRFNSYKSTHGSFIKKNTVKQASFHAHFEDDRHLGMKDWEITPIDQTGSVDDLRRRQANELDESDVTPF